MYIRLFVCGIFQMRECATVSNKICGIKKVFDGFMSPFIVPAMAKPLGGT